MAHRPPSSALLLLLATLLLAACGASASVHSPPGQLTLGCWQHTATTLPNGLILIAGGYDIDGTVTASAELYDPLADTGRPTAPLITARTHHSATPLLRSRMAAC